MVEEGRIELTTFMNRAIEFVSEICSFKGRKSRAQFIAHFILSNVIMLITIYVLLGIVSTAKGFVGKETMESAFSHAALIKLAYSLSMAAYAIDFVSNLANTVRRLHDRGHSGWCVLWGLFPILNIIFIFYLVFAEGEGKENRYGPDPRITGFEKNIW
jgi:uncharacterized membrane protein YhaH (DUF805 family)